MTLITSSRSRTLRAKGEDAHLLVMTATPIPRSLALTLYGDLDVTVLDEMPPGRKPIRTGWRQASDRAKAVRFIREEVSRGRQGSVVYPLVESAEGGETRAATEAFDDLAVMNDRTERDHATRTTLIKRALG